MGLFDKFKQNKQEEQEYDSLIKAALEKYTPALHKVKWLYDIDFVREISITQAYYWDLKFYFGYYNKEKPVKGDSRYLWFYKQNQSLTDKDIEILEELFRIKDVTSLDYGRWSFVSGIIAGFHLAKITRSKK